MVMEMHLLYVAVMGIVLLVIVAPMLAVVLLLARGKGSGQRDQQLSADGNWWWNGSQWVPTLSADGTWRWDGKSWRAVHTPG